MLDLPTPPLPEAMPMTVVRLPASKGEGRSSPPVRPARRARRSSSVMVSRVTCTTSTPGHAAEGVGDPALDLGLQGAAGDRQADRDGDVPAADLDLADHAEVDDAAVQLGVVDRPQQLDDRLARRRAHMNIRA